MNSDVKRRRLPRPRKNITDWLLLVCAATCSLLLCAHTGHAYSERATPSTHPTLVLAQLFQPSHEFSDCPMLPELPGGLSIPLPPGQREEAPPPTAGPAVEAPQLAEGKGKYEGMLFVPAGAFDMGSPEGKGRPDERPQHRVFLKPYFISRIEVTVREYCRFLNSQGESSKERFPRVKLDVPDCPVVQERGRFQPKEGYADKPMVCVSWYGAADYARWVGGRLPTSAEWERAAMLSTGQPPVDLIFAGASETAPATNGQAQAEPLSGSMIGDVWQWCADWYSTDYYGQSPSENPAGPERGEDKVIRGGSRASAHSSKRIENVHNACPRGYYRSVGFRIVKD
ncbi:MAG: SUMF1/EgtB/PvdO family nonheme iron enzyme [Desulfomonile tiedjei]|nr:SUMF1/EgtB/PvdO family nonheme iron enzyme [Desulfomonile tiedjei]